MTTNRPAASSRAAYNRMKANRRVDTKPEIAIRSRLHRRGLRFRVDMRVEPTVRTRPDIVFTRRRLAIYIDGCFWHGCPIHGTWAKQNAEFWREKIETNRKRDIQTNQALSELGWHVLRIWEHEPVEDAVEKIVSCLACLKQTST